MRKKFSTYIQYEGTTKAIGFVGLLPLRSLLFVYVQHTLRHKDYVLLASRLFFALSMLVQAWVSVLFCVFFPLFAALSAKANKRGLTGY